jgi:type VI protein secretion system component Hcp
MEADMPVFMKFDGIEGDSTDASHVGWFELNNFDFGVTTPTSTGAGGGSGRSQFSPVTVDLHSATGLTALLGAELDHHIFKSVELVETTGGENPQTILDVKLTNVTLSAFVNAPGASGPQESLTLNFTKISVTYRPQNSDGSLGQPQTFVSDVPSSGTPAIPPGVHEAEVTPVPSPSPVHYFLKIDGVTGDSRDAAHPGWFNVDGFDFGVTTPANGAGATIGRSHISPLLVDIHSVTGLAALLGDEVDHRVIKSVELVGVEGGFEKGQQTVYDLKLSNVTLGSLHNEPGAQGIEADLAFNFQKGSLTQAGTTQTFGSNSGGAAATLPQDAEVTAVPASSPVHYFLKVAGVTGDSRDAAHPGWFSVDGFDFGITTPTSTGAGGASGRSHISPLSVDIQSVLGLAALLGDEVTNHVIKSVELVGVEAGGEEQQTVYDLKLTNVQLDGLHNAPGAQGVEADLAFNFQRGSLTQGDTTQSFGSSSGAALPAVQDTEVTAVPATSPVHYFLKVDGVTGDSRDAAHPGWFTVDGFDFGITTPTSAGSSGASGRSHISPLAVDIDSVTGLAALLGDAVNHHIIKSVELVGVENGGKGEQQTVYDLKLSNVTLDSLHNEPGAQGGIETDLGFDFQRGSLTQGETTQTFGSSSGATAALPQDTGVTPVSASSATHYFLKVAGATGDSTDAEHPGWFSVDGFDFGVTTPTSAGTGGALGRSHVSPLSVDISSASGLAALLGDEVNHRLLTSVELVGVESGEKQQTIYDLKLSNVSLDSFHNEPGAQGVETELAFNFQKGSLTQGETSQAFGASSGAAAAIPAAQSTEATPVPAASPVQYFLKVAGVTGDSTDAAHPGWFSVDGFGVGASTNVNAGTGQPTGRSHFAPLTVDTDSLTGITALLTDEVNHRLIKSAELVGVAGAPGQQQTVYDLKLSSLHVTTLHSTPDPQGGVETEFTLSFGRATLTDLASTPGTTAAQPIAPVQHDVLPHDHGWLV